ncbi:dienelactone hydrolase family protein [Hyphomonas johnsonii]|jgi:carboxymethylenebutenolidase|uniref:Carboxymethylenebutenolidase n=1 Tax=Hyphomonas johnsonii MHS-2 TaxID=1280950 RepID=A0A059FHD8_9PROT|nr:dienelactone hydrolase family protein [Hyphomonas johnsonii]KCZ90034.1 carboxymethylenebutenolidase [Hyphomonas johnsonii MHS-2]
MSHRPDSLPVPQGALDLYDAYAHGAMSRRAFFEGLGKYAVGGLTVSMLAACMMPDYDSKLQTSPDDPRLKIETFAFASPTGAGDMSGDLVRLKDGPATRPGVVVVHENRGLNPHIKDVARRAALAGYVVLAPDALFPLGGYPGNDDDGRALQSQRDSGAMVQDFMAAADTLRAHPECNGKVACVGFCFGGAVTNLMAVNQPWLSAAVPFYGGWPDTKEAAIVKVPLMIHLAGLDERVNAGWPPYEAALKAAGADYQAFIYEGVNHGFNNDTTPRYDADAAKLAWSRTLDFFKAKFA